jgi:hypothetical protein
MGFDCLLAPQGNGIKQSLCCKHTNPSQRESFKSLWNHRTSFINCDNCYPSPLHHVFGSELFNILNDGPPAKTKLWDLPMLSSILTHGRWSGGWRICRVGGLRFLTSDPWSIGALLVVWTLVRCENPDDSERSLILSGCRTLRDFGSR